MQADQTNTRLVQNKTIARQFVERLVAQNPETVVTLLADEWVDHSRGPGLPSGVDGAKAFFAMIWSAFPDLQITIEDVIAEGDKVVMRLRAAGVNHGSLMGMPATGKSATWSVMDIHRIVDGKLVEHWCNSDDLGMMQQLGLIPPPQGL